MQSIFSRGVTSKPSQAPAALPQGRQVRGHAGPAHLYVPGQYSTVGQRRIPTHFLYLSQKLVDWLAG